MSIGKICSREVHLAEAHETVLAAAMRMKAHNVGTLVVVDEKHPIGILTDRDLVVRVMAEERSPAATLVESVMSYRLRTVSEQASVEDALASMRGLGARRLPVVGRSGELVGIVSLDDVLELLAGELDDVRRLLVKSHTAASATPQAR
jgi:CBS domain-containing protein